MNWYRSVYFYVVFIALIAAGCGPSMQQAMQKEVMERTTLTAYERNEQQVQTLKQGDRIDNKIKWDAYSFQNQGKSTYLMVADGWIGPLSGQYPGGIFGFGHVYARSGKTVFGEHVFGYLRYGTTLVPKYSVITQAELITPEEYKAFVKAKKTGTIGWFHNPNWNDNKQLQKIPPVLHFKNVSVRKVRELAGVNEGTTEVTIEKAGSLDDVVRSYLTKAKFLNAEKKLKNVKTGSTPWDVMQELSGIYMTPNSGLDYLLLMDGFLMYKSEGPWQKMTSKGLYVVWPFGYLENEVEMPQLDVIFKNGKLHKLVKHAPKERIESQYMD